jgi:hypothetical protein
MILKREKCFKNKLSTFALVAKIRLRYNKNILRMEFCENDNYIVYIFVSLLSDSNENNRLNKRKLNFYSKMRINTHSCVIKLFSKGF